MNDADDIGTAIGAAERAFAGGRLDEALRCVRQVLDRRPSHGGMLHLLALIEKRAGRANAARAAFARARIAAPNDAAILSNEANLLESVGEDAAALAGYDAALAIAPDFADARYNRAVLLQRLDRPDEALAELDRLLQTAPQARVHSARGTALQRLGRPAAAARAFDLALSLEPERPVALHGRARAAMETGDPAAPDHYERALRCAPGDPALVLGLVESLHAGGDPAGAELLGQVLQARPEWVEGHEAFALMQSERGEGTDHEHYRHALARRPTDHALRLSYWRTLLRAGQYGEALAGIDAARAQMPGDPQIALIEAAARLETGDARGADTLLALMPPSAEVAVMRGRIALRDGDPAQAAQRLQSACDAHPGSVAAWAWLGLAWRLLDDPRARWLYGQPGLIGAIDLDLDAAMLADLAILLRSLHRMHAHPIGQSLRGGTQTRGRLFWRPEPQLAALHAALAEAVRAHVAAWRDVDPAHPLLRHRNDRLTLGGSWSVRLSGGGHHVGHIHPEGVLSSACYVALPPADVHGETRAGWLELGAAPAGSRIDLPPLATIEPKPGRLALFPSYVFHGTRPFRTGERLAVAFDVVASAA